MPALDAVEHLVGMQAQVPHDPYLGLWSRLEGFAPEALSRLLVQRQVVRITVMRSTIHLVSADDCLLLRPLVQPVVDAELRRHPDFAPLLRDVDLGPVLAFARERLAASPATGPQLRAALAERFPAHDAAALAFACRCRLALVQVPPRGVWGQSRQVTVTTAESWLGRPLDAQPSIDDVVVRYLAAFGPASVADIASWSRLTGMRAVVDRLAPRLRAFRDERGRVLWDLPDAPRPDPDTPAPPRFLPEYDNVLLSHADRGRFHSDAPRVQTPHDPRLGKGIVLHDGTGSATWRIERDPLRLEVTPFVALAPSARDEIAAEGERVVRFITDGAGSDVRVTG